MAIDYEELRKLVDYGLKKGLIVAPDSEKYDESPTEEAKKPKVCVCGEEFIPRTSRIVRCDTCIGKTVECVICGESMKIRYKSGEEYVKCCSKKECIKKHLSITKKNRDIRNKSA